MRRVRADETAAKKGSEKGFVAAGKWEQHREPAGESYTAAEISDQTVL